MPYVYTDLHVHLLAAFVILLTTAYSLLDMVWWAQLTMLVCLPYVRRSTLRTILKRMITCVITTIMYRFVIFPCTPSIVTDVFYFAFLAFAPLVALMTLVNGCAMLRDGLRLRAAMLSCVSVRQHTEQQRRLAWALARAAEEGFDDADPETLYCLGPPIGAGSFGRVFFAKPASQRLGSPWTLALKKIKIDGECNKEPDIASAVSNLIIGAIVNNAKMMSKGARTLYCIIFGKDEHFEEALARGVAELRVLSAVRCLRHPSLIRLIGAHKQPARISPPRDASVTIVTELGGPQFLTAAMRMCRSERIVLFGRLLSALAAMHASG